MSFSPFNSLQWKVYEDFLILVLKDYILMIFLLYQEKDVSGEVLDPLNIFTESLKVLGVPPFVSPHDMLIL